MADKRKNHQASSDNMIPRGESRSGSRMRSQQVYSQQYQAYDNNSSEPPAATYGFQSDKHKYDPGKSGKKKKGGVWRVVFWIALIVFIVSLVALGLIGYSYWKNQDTYNQLAEKTLTPEDIANTSLADMTLDWDALRAINPDTVGWIYVPDTVINYPIVHTTDNDKYLKTNFYGDEDWTTAAGTIFLSAENSPDFSFQNNVIYGHHMRDGSMFAQFAKFQDSKLFNENREIFILTPTGNYKLETFSIFVCDANDPLGQVRFSDETEFTEYVQDKVSRSVVTPSPHSDLAAVDQVFTFVTCTGFADSDDRTVLFAYPVETSTFTSEGSDGSVIDDDAADNIDDATKEL